MQLVVVNFWTRKHKFSHYPAIIKSISSLNPPAGFNVSLCVILSKVLLWPARVRLVNSPVRMWEKKERSKRFCCLEDKKKKNLEKKIYSACGETSSGMCFPFHLVKHTHTRAHAITSNNNK